MIMYEFYVCYHCKEGFVSNVITRKNSIKDEICLKSLQDHLEETDKNVVIINWILLREYESEDSNNET